MPFFSAGHVLCHLFFEEASPTDLTALGWVESHPIIIELVKMAVPAIIVWLFYNIKFRRDIRVKARISFYPTFINEVAQLQTALSICTETANPFCLLYNQDARMSLQLTFPRNYTAQQFIDFLKPIATSIEATKSLENNIPPSLLHWKKIKWRESQRVVYSFVYYILNGTEFGSITDARDLSYRTRWNILSEAIKYLIRKTPTI